MWPGVPIARSGQAAKVHLLLVVEPAMRELDPTGSRRQDGRPDARELATAGNEVRVEVGLEAVCQSEAVLLGGAGVRADVPGRIDDESSAIAEVDEIGRVTEPFVDEWDDRDQRSLPDVPFAGSCVATWVSYVPASRSTTGAISSTSPSM